MPSRMSPNAALPPRGTALLLALVTGLLLFRLGDAPLVGPDEPRYARVAVEMFRRGDWIVPTLQGQPWLEKPALYYWMAGAAFSLPPSLGEWTLFSKAFYPRAFEAWYREFGTRG